MLSIVGGDPSFRDDDGSVRPEVAAALAKFAAREGSEHAALTALAGARLLVPVVAVLAEQLSGDEADRGRPDTGDRGERTAADAGAGHRQPGGTARGTQGGEKTSEMAMPTLIGMDGRRAVPAFTCLDSMRRWQPEARPVPVTALAVWQAAVADSCAVVVDVAGPVPIAVEGARLAALARGEEAPPPYADPDVHDIVAEVLTGRLEVRSFELWPGGDGQDLTIALTLADEGGHDVDELAGQIGSAIMSRLGGRLRRGVAIWLNRDGGRS